MNNALKPIQNEKTEHLMWFIEHGFHQMTERKQLAREELIRRGERVSKLKDGCICNECKTKEL